MAGTPHTPRNKMLAGGILKYSRSAMYKKKALYKRKKIIAKAPVKKRAYFKIKPVKGEKNGDKRVVLLSKARRYYPTEDEPRKLRTRKNPKPPKLRGSITPGTVLILVAGRHMGKRVVFLKQLESSGLLIVTGPFCINGTPLRRVDQAYVIATQTKVDISTVNLPDTLNDGFFKRTKSEKKKKGDGDIFSDTKKDYLVSDVRKETQKTVDKQLVPLISGVPSLKQYLRHKFTLSHGQFPHKMVF